MAKGLRQLPQASYYCSFGRYGCKSVLQSEHPSYMPVYRTIREAHAEVRI